MSIRYSEVFPILAKSITGVEADDEDRKEPTPYFFLADMVRFVCHRNASGSTLEAVELGELFERLLMEGDADVGDLVLDGLETLRDEGRCGDNIAQYFGTKTMALWNRVSMNSQARAKKS
jgi:hypothetical protein